MRIRLRPKVDRRGRTYLFAGIEAINAVVFIHELDTPDDNGCTHELVVKPYEGQRRGPKRQEGGAGGGAGGEDDDDYAAAWAVERSAKPLHRRAA